eukprot:9831941-Lingulodinium_polyedra.AAC.1
MCGLKSAPRPCCSTPCRKDPTFQPMTNGPCIFNSRGRAIYVAAYADDLFCVGEIHSVAYDFEQIKRVCVARRSRYVHANFANELFWPAQFASRLVNLDLERS